MKGGPGPQVQPPQPSLPAGRTVGQMIPGFGNMNQNQRVQATMQYGQQHGMDMSQPGWARNGVAPPRPAMNMDARRAMLANIGGGAPAQPQGNVQANMIANALMGGMKQRGRIR
jgi:hypothetical protein